MGREDGPADGGSGCEMGLIQSGIQRRESPEVPERVADGSFRSLRTQQRAKSQRQIC
jgi:hypothetical protein